MVRLLLACVFLLQAAPREKAADFPAHAQLKDLGLGVEYLAHSLFSSDQTLLVKDYVIVEVGLFPAKGKPLTVSHGQFTLRINGKKTALLAQTPAFVAASVKYEDWEVRPTLTGGVGMGDGSVILGRPRQTSRFPGDPTERNRLPKPPQAPAPEDRSGVDKAPPVKPEELVVRAALVEGEVGLPVTGVLYFPFKGKVKSVSLLYTGPAGTAEIPL